MLQNKERNKKQSLVFKLLGIIFSVVPPAVCTLLYFPLYGGTAPEKLISLGAVLLLTVSFLPLMRIVTARLKTPSATVVWLVIFTLFYLLHRIAEQMIVISFFGFLGNLLGSVFFKLSRKRRIKDE